MITVPSGTIQQDLTTTILRWADLSARMSGSENTSGRGLHLARPSGLSAHLAAQALRPPVRRLAGGRAANARRRPARALAYRIGIHRGEASTAELARLYEAYLAGQKASWLD